MVQVPVVRKTTPLKACEKRLTACITWRALYLPGPAAVDSTTQGCSLRENGRTPGVLVDIVLKPGLDDLLHGLPLPQDKLQSAVRVSHDTESSSTLDVDPLRAVRVLVHQRLGWRVSSARINDRG